MLDRGDASHERAASWGSAATDELVTTPLVLAETDHLLRRFGRRVAADAFRHDLEAGAYRVMWWKGALNRVLAVTRDRPDIGLTDASLVALAAQLETTSVATLDERHFRTLKPLTGEPAFTLLPADA